MQAPFHLYGAGALDRRIGLMPLKTYLVASLTLVLGTALLPWVSPLLGSLIASWILHAGYYAAVAITLVATFRWGARCGFTLRDETGEISISHFLRNLVMSGLMFVGVTAIAAPFISFAYALSRG